VHREQKEEVGGGESDSENLHAASQEKIACVAWLLPHRYCRKSSFEEGYGPVLHRPVRQGSLINEESYYVFVGSSERSTSQSTELRPSQ